MTDIICPDMGIYGCQNCYKEFNKFFDPGTWIQIPRTKWGGHRKVCKECLERYNAGMDSVDPDFLGVTEQERMENRVAKMTARGVRAEIEAGKELKSIGLIIALIFFGLCFLFG